MTLSTIRNQIIASIGGRTDVNDLIDDQINFALDELTTMFEFEELEGNATTTTSDGQSEYSLPSDLYVLWSVKEETKRNKPLEYKQIRLGYDNIDETKTGVPTMYSVYAKTLTVYGMVPDDNAGSDYTLRIRYWKIQARLSNDADNHVLPQHWERGVRLKATAFVMDELDMIEKAAAKHAEFDRWLGRIKLPKGAEKEKAKNSRMNFGVNR
jgi:hypothetical protein